MGDSVMNWTYPVYLQVSILTLNSFGILYIAVVSIAKLFYEFTFYGEIIVSSYSGRSKMQLPRHL